MARTTSRIVEALQNLNDDLKSAQINSLDLAEPAGGISLGMTSLEVVASNGPRLVSVTNISNATIFFNRDVDAEMDKGDALPPGDSKIIPLGKGQALNGIASSAAAKLSFQVYG